MPHPHTGLPAETGPHSAACLERCPQSPGRTSGTVWTGSRSVRGHPPPPRRRCRTPRLGVRVRECVSVGDRLSGWVNQWGRSCAGDVCKRGRGTHYKGKWGGYEVVGWWWWWWWRGLGRVCGNPIPLPPATPLYTPPPTLIPNHPPQTNPTPRCMHKPRQPQPQVPPPLPLFPPSPPPPNPPLTRSL